MYVNACIWGLHAGGRRDSIRAHAAANGATHGATDTDAQTVRGQSAKGARVRAPPDVHMPRHLLTCTELDPLAERTHTRGDEWWSAQRGTLARNARCARHDMSGGHV